MSERVTLEKHYDPQSVEGDIYARWERTGAFRADPEKRSPLGSYTIVIPPPNVTGALHLGHALNNTLQDILIRYHRMRGFNTLWQPGTDHAGIATQAVVERRIRETEGKTRHELGREELVRCIWAWKDEYEKRILNQLKMMGCSCDWGYKKINTGSANEPQASACATHGSQTPTGSRELKIAARDGDEQYECDWSNTRFTLDEGLARAVRHMFFNLFKDGLIFRGKRLVNWDTQLQTAVSDDEVYYETVKGHFYHFKYPILRHEGTEAWRHEGEGDGPSHGATKPQSHEGKSMRRGGEGEAPTEPQSVPRPQGSGVGDSEPDFVIIATTRPETMLGDVAVAVHPDPKEFFDHQREELTAEWERIGNRSGKESAEIEAKLAALAARRESHLAQLVTLSGMARAGRKLRLPLMDREIPLITDEWANPLLGSGCVKITPAHDPNDYNVGLRHNLAMINVLTPDGKIAPIVEPDPSAAPTKPAGNENANSDNYAGLAFSSEGRAKVVADMEALGLIEAIEDRDIELGHSDRSKLPIEPYLSDQWFVRTADNEPRTSVRATQRAANFSSRDPVGSSTNPKFSTPDLGQGATLLTWTTYGTWLPGDERGSVSRAPRAGRGQELRNLPGEPYDDADPERYSEAEHRMEGEPVRLSLEQARAALESFGDTCERHGIEPLAIAIMANHVHILCQGDQAQGDLLQLFKGASSRHLNLKADLRGAPRWWTRGGSRRRIRAGADLTAALRYVKEQEYALCVWSFDLQAGYEAEIFGQSRARVASGGSERHGVARTEVRGSLGLASAAMKAVEDGRIAVFPSRYAKSYLDWLGEKRDWCISRQLWWGHRIPVWSIEIPKPWTTSNLQNTVLARLFGELSDGTCSQIIMDDGRSFEVGGVSGAYGQLFEMRDSGGWDAAARWDVCLDTDARDSFDTSWEKALAECGFSQDPDVLDTWFSSALWPFSTLGWPEQTERLKTYYPGSVLVTSRDIITNWVARMVMFGLYARGEVPFRHVYIHPKILDGRGETMSKSKGNGVDPIDIIHTHGADALRYSMADLTTETQDIRMPVDYLCPHCGKLTEQAAAIKVEEQNRKSRGIKFDRKLQPADCQRVKCSHKECGKDFATQWADAATKEQLGVGRETSEKFEIGRNFCNKLWNAARYAFMNLEPTSRAADFSQRGDSDTADSSGIRESARTEVRGSLLPEDRWILARLSQTIRAYHQAIGSYQFSASVKDLREFFWDALCDWYIELTKPRLGASVASESPPLPRGDEGGSIIEEGEPPPTPSLSRRGVSDPAAQVLAFCLDQVLRLWHPTIPFITERLWQQLNELVPRRGISGVAELKTDTDLILAEFPPLEGYPAVEDEKILRTFADLQDAVRGVRDLRAQCGVSPKDAVTVTVIVAAENIDAFKAHAHIVHHMAGIGELRILDCGFRPPNSASINIRNLRVFVHDVTDDTAERTRAKKELEIVEKQIAGKEGKLRNQQFVTNAKPEVVKAESDRLSELVAQRETLRHHLAELS